ncbi:MAG: cupin domain-containing protein [Pseudomonadota bacterium]
MTPITAEQIIDRLALEPHPEGGWYKETWRAESVGGARPVGTAIYFLLRRGEASHWHRVDATEIWHHYAGAPLTLSMAETAEGPAHEHMLGPDFSAGEAPQIIVPEGHWQAARATGAFTLVGCTVSPGFRFEGFELAPPDFTIPKV